jgi:membrane-bound serine protease (ClpP class)
MLRYRLANNPTRTEGGTERLIPIRTDDDLKAFFGATSLHRMNANWSEGLVVILTNMFVRAVLLIVFLVALFVEMSHPGALVPGAIAAIALVLLLGPPMLVGLAAWWEIGAILLGLVLVAIEIFAIPGFGVIGIAGLILLFVGMVATFSRDGGGFPDSAANRAELLKGATTVLVSMITAGVAMYFVAKHFGSLPLLNRFVLKSTGPDDEEAFEGAGTLIAAMGEEDAPARLGDMGKAITPLRPAGRVQINDRMVDAVAELGYIPAGAIVRVSSVTAFRVGVELVKEPT